jgi:hypothetical protein
VQPSASVPGPVRWRGPQREYAATPDDNGADIFLFMNGGVSHVDSFDHKPKLYADHSKQVTIDHPQTRNCPGYEKLFLRPPDWTFTRHGKSGIEVSTMFPHLARCVDDIAIIRSIHTSHSNHYNATLGMHTGSFAFARPSLGGWVSYGLGTENRNLPSVDEPSRDDKLPRDALCATAFETIEP